MRGALARLFRPFVGLGRAIVSYGLGASGGLVDGEAEVEVADIDVATARVADAPIATCACTDAAIVWVTVHDEEEFL